MIKKLTLLNFRNFENKSLNFEKEKNIIIWENWKGKTNILESICLFSNTSLLEIDYFNLVKNDKDFLFLKLELFSWDELWISYEKETNKKKFFINKKIVSKWKLEEYSPKIVSFHPMIMNMMYLSPSLRRFFLDNILINCYPEYDKLLRIYKKTLKSRNRVLKNIYEGKSKKDEIDFWNKQFVNNAEEIYKYREKIISYFEENISDSSIYFNNKINKVHFEYKTKIDRKDVRKSLENYINKNLDRDIILRKTYIWPHLDDFDIILDDVYSLINFASRWEVKSMILWLKFIEAKFIETIINKKTVFIIDDLLSEIDIYHREILLKNINNNQTFITSINDIDINSNKFSL